MNLHRLQRVLLLTSATAFGLASRLDSANGQSGQSPPPVDQVVMTKDGVQLKLTYYASPAGQDAVPVVMLHDYNETRAVFAPLALALQNPPTPKAASQPKIAPRAVITVDLRGHGDSKGALDPDGSPIELD